MTSLAPGQPAPPFSLPVGEDRSLTLADYAGRALVVYFYPKDDTSGCTAEAIDFNKLRPAFEAAGCALLGVSPDSLASHAKFARKYELGFDLGADTGKATLEAYGVWVEKSMYGRKYMGVERTTVLIDKNGQIARVWSKVKVPGHAAEVLAAAQALA